MKLVLKVDERGNSYKLMTETGEEIEGVAEIELPTLRYGHDQVVTVRLGYLDMHVNLGLRDDHD